MHFLDLTLRNSAGKPVRIPAFTARWWFLAAVVGLGGAGLMWGGLVLLSLMLV